MRRRRSRPGTAFPPAGRASCPGSRGARPGACAVVRELVAMGFRALATEGTAASLRELAIPVEEVPKVGEGKPDVVDRIEAREVDLVINTVDASSVAVR